MQPLKEKILRKKVLIKKHETILKKLIETCGHEETHIEESYSDGGYDYYASTTYTTICDICGSRVDNSVREHNWR